jgi:hypothetical protein
MSKLSVLKDKDPKETARLLSMVSVSLLPNPGIHQVLAEGEKDSEFVKAVLTEIRDRLRLPQGDNSIMTQSLIYSFLSEEISRAALANVDLNELRSRLGNKGELHPSQYEVRFRDNFSVLEYLGIRKSHAAQAVTHPDQTTNVKAKYLPEDPHVTISIKTVTGKRIEDKFILLVISERKGQVQEVGFAVRVYLSDVDLSDVSEPLDVLREFNNSFGSPFRYGEVKSIFMHNEIVRVGNRVADPNLVELLDGAKRKGRAPVLISGPTRLRGKDNEILSEVVLGFVVNIPKYVKMLRKHNVYIAPEAESFFELS